MKNITLESVEKALNGWLRPKLCGEPWDNTGILVGSGLFSKEEKPINSILVCNDLTTKVVNEAIKLKVELIVAYHPIILRDPVKAVGYGHWKQQILAKCLAHDISVYTPHATLDAAIGGINDRIMRYFRSNLPTEESSLTTIFPPHVDESCPGLLYRSTAENISKLYASLPLDEITDVAVGFDVDSVLEGKDDKVGMRVYSLRASSPDVLQKIKDISSSLTIQDFRATAEAPPAVLGTGRILHFKRSVAIEKIVKSLSDCTGVPKIKLSQDPKSEIQSIGLCVGSGITILQGLKVDVLVTGEMKHSETLDCLENNQTVILCGHADSERHYLPTLAETLKIITQCPNVYVSKADQSIFNFV